jgi:hypothetical protein
MTQPPEKLFRRRIQIDRFSAFMEALAGGTAQHGSATGRNNSASVLGQLVQYSLLHIPKVCLAIAFKGLADRVTQTIFNNVVGIEK